MFKINNKNTRTRCEIYSKLTVKTSGVFNVNWEHISHFVLVLILSSQMPAGPALQRRLKLERSKNVTLL